MLTVMSQVPSLASGGGVLVGIGLGVALDEGDGVALEEGEEMGVDAALFTEVGVLFSPFWPSEGGSPEEYEHPPATRTLNANPTKRW
jgi:hypothetical protein